ncbi:response regulator [Larkinella terrae]|uniref:Response regulator n=1 Tax=Larkinella terrae TaxID=2025311 RepID=A0A7K0EL60_9BACT|nr:response regulator [Larkinella terrae]MRS62442.1 response regulator [Larkinella terrae]
MNSQPRILLADDDPAIRKFLSQILRKAGYQVVMASDGLEAIELLKTEPRPDLLLLDVMMPESTGLDVVAKSNELPQPVPAILMSAIDLPPVQRMVLLASPTPYLIKPFKPNELLSKIESILASASI